MLQNEEIKKHELYKQLAIESYTFKKESTIEDYKLKNRYPMDKGFYACVYNNNRETVLVYKGTEFFDKEDLKNDLQMFFYSRPEQIKNAIAIYNKVHEECNLNGTDMIVVGHSLGGSLAQIIGALCGVTVVTFNAYGVKRLLPYSMKYYYATNITNYCNVNDPITSYNAINHIGKCYAVSSKGKGFAHFLEYMAPLYTRKEVHPSELQKRPQDIVYNNINKVKTYSKELSDHFGRNIILMPGLHSDDNTCSGSYPVRGYERKDGTKVDGYIRECFKHGNSQTQPAREKYKGMKLNQLNKINY